MKQKRVSVAMTVYNGAKYVSQQLDSILRQLTSEDEIIISYNKSTDNTWEIIKDYERRFSQIVQVIVCEKMGIRANGENARSHCSGKYIFISDQDDYWLDGKVAAIIDAFERTNAPVVLHNMYYANADLVPTEKTLFNERHSKPGFIRNLIKNSYHGGCMAINSKYYPLMADRPSGVGFGDMWMGLVGEMCGHPVFLSQVYMYFRCHDNNLSSRKRRPMAEILPERFRLLWHLAKRFPRIIKYRITQK